MISLRDLRDVSLEYTSGCPDHHLNCVIQITLICKHTGQNTVIQMIHNSNDHTNRTLLLCENPLSSASLHFFIMLPFPSTIPLCFNCFPIPSLSLHILSKFLHMHAAEYHLCYEVITPGESKWSVHYYFFL